MPRPILIGDVVETPDHELVVVNYYDDNGIFMCSNNKSYFKHQLTFVCESKSLRLLNLEVVKLRRDLETLQKLIAWFDKNVVIKENQNK